MTNKQFLSILALKGLNQSNWARIIGVSNNTVSTTLKRDKVPVLWRLAVLQIESYDDNEIDVLMGVN